MRPMHNPLVSNKNPDRYYVSILLYSVSRHCGSNLQIALIVFLSLFLVLINLDLSRTTTNLPEEVPKFTGLKKYTNTSRSVQELIPHKLWFTYKHDILKEKDPLKFYDNIQKTIGIYRNAWGEPDTPAEVLSNERCVEMIVKALLPKKDDSEKVILDYFFTVKGAFKADICRIAVLYLYGGYYFDIDIQVIEPYLASPDVSFVTADNLIAKVFFQAFIASSPKHPVLADNLEKLVLVARGKFALSKFGPKQVNFVGPETLRLSYFDVSPERRGNTFLLEENNIQNLAPFERYNISRQDGEGVNCNWVVCSPREYKAYFYSRFIGATEQCRLKNSTNT